MTKSITKLRLELPTEVHEAVKSVQFKRAAKDGVKTNLNEILVELIRNSKPVNRAANAILERVAKKSEK
jgi:phosphotransferase system IIB component